MAMAKGSEGTPVGNDRIQSATGSSTVKCPVARLASPEGSPECCSESHAGSLPVLLGACPVSGRRPSSTAGCPVASPTSDKARSCKLQVDSDFVIRLVDERACKLLKYERCELVGKPILELMPPLVAEFHKQIFRRMKVQSKSDICLMGNRLLRDMSLCREFVVLDAHRDPIVCKVSVDLREDLSSSVIIGPVEGNLLHTVPLGYERFINAKPGLHVDDFDDVVCIMMDIAGSTQFSGSQPPATMAKLFHEVYTTVSDVINREVFPYAYIHEIVGDSVLLIVNAGFMVRFPQQAAAIGFQVAAKAQHWLDAMLQDYSAAMYTRVGIAIGPVSAGVVDGRTFRVFGSTVHKSQRLESKCGRSQLACCPGFFELLQEQVQDLPVSSQIVEAELKGFGSVRFAMLQTPDPRTSFGG